MWTMPAPLPRPGSISRHAAPDASNAAAKLAVLAGIAAGKKKTHRHGQLSAPGLPTAFAIVPTCTAL
jgi:hypothetical protein